MTDTSDALIRQAADTCAGGNLRAFAALIQTPYRTVQYWCAQPAKMPGAAIVLVRLLAETPEVRYLLRPESEL